MSAIPYCEQYGTRLVTQYEALSFEDVHADRPLKKRLG